MMGLINNSVVGSKGINIVQLAGVGISLTVLYALGLIVYRRHFHPLAKYPGPFFNSISTIPAGLGLIRGRFPFDNKLNHEKYGSVVRLGPEELIFNTSQALHDIYGFRQGHHTMHKSPLHTGPVQVGATTTIQYTVDDAEHVRQRRALSHSFSTRALMEQETIVQDYSSKFINQMRRLAAEGHAFNIGDWFCYFTFDTMGDLTFNESFGCLDRGDFHEWVDYLFHTIKDGAFIQATRRIAGTGTWLQVFLQRRFKGMGEALGYHLKHTREKVLKRLEMDQVDHRDFIWYILKQAEKFDLQQDEIIANSGLFIVAGSETTATALSGLMARLIWNPRCYDLLVSEIRSRFVNEENITFANVEKMPYLDACIQEVLRIHPPIPAGPPRVVPPGGDTIDGKFIPGGTTVSVGAWSACHNAAHFKNPDHFIPERWIDEEYASDVKKAAQPFSLGARNCIGKNLAIMEMRVLLARLFWNFDMTSEDGAPLWDPRGEMRYKQAFMVWEKSVVNVKLRNRKATGA